MKDLEASPELDFYWRAAAQALKEEEGSYGEASAEAQGLSEQCIISRRDDLTVHAYVS